MKNPNSIMKEGYLTKEGAKANKKITKRLVILKLKQLEWFHDDSEFKKNRPLGVIPLTSIYHAIAANRFKETSDIIVNITCLGNYVLYRLVLAHGKRKAQ